jgi:hypothetical protein
MVYIKDGPSKPGWNIRVGNKLSGEGREIDALGFMFVVSLTNVPAGGWNIVSNTAAVSESK